MTTAPLSSEAVSSPHIVTIGIAALRNACPNVQTRSASPFERAVTTYGLLISSSIAPRATWAIRPIGRNASVKAGKTVCSMPP